jgi:hypothetical protein
MEKATVLLKWDNGLAWEEVGGFEYDGEEDLRRKKEQLRELLRRIRVD